MKTRAKQTMDRLSVAVLTVALVVVAVLAGRARAQVVTPRPENLRFEMVLSEPIAMTGRTGVVAGTSAVLLKDRRTGQCHVAITIGSAMGMAPAECGN